MILQDNIDNMIIFYPRKGVLSVIDKGSYDSFPTGYTVEDRLKKGWKSLGPSELCCWEE